MLRGCWLFPCLSAISQCCVPAWPRPLWAMTPGVTPPVHSPQSSQTEPSTEAPPVQILPMIPQCPETTRSSRQPSRPPYDQACPPLHPALQSLSSSATKRLSVPQTLCAPPCPCTRCPLCLEHPLPSFPRPHRPLVLPVMALLVLTCSKPRAPRAQ